MNKDETTKPKETLTPKEIKEDTRGGVKDDLAKPAPKLKGEKPKEEATLKAEVTKKEFMIIAAFSDRLVRVERMLEWLVVQRVTDNQKLVKQPNISDILKEIMSKMEPVKTVAKMVDEAATGLLEKKKDEVQTPT